MWIGKSHCCFINLYVVLPVFKGRGNGNLICINISYGNNFFSGQQLFELFFLKEKEANIARTSLVFFNLVHPDAGFHFLKKFAAAMQ